MSFIKNSLLPSKRPEVAYAFAWFFCVLASYSMIRPVRETMGTHVGKAELKWLFLAGFVAVLLLVPLYALVVQMVSRKSVARVVFHGFALSSICFFLILRTFSASEYLWIARILFVWISVFGIFSTSVFWSVLADLFSSNQGKQLFGVVASGGTLGAISGALLTSQIAERFDPAWIMLFPAILLELGLWFARRLEVQSRHWRIRETEPVSANEVSRPLATKWFFFSAVHHVLRSSYLLRLCAFLMLVQAFGTLLYTEQASIVKDTIAAEHDRIQFFAYVDFASQSLTLALQFLVSGWLMQRHGIAVALVVLPVIYSISLFSLSIAPDLIVLAVVMVATRSFAYGLTVPAREVLFTVVSPEEKYKAKSFIDTVVVRGGDSISMQLIGLLQNAGVTIGVMNLAAIPIAFLWAGIAWSLGKKQADLAAASALPEVVSDVGVT